MSKLLQYANSVSTLHGSVHREYSTVNANFAKRISTKETREIQLIG